MQLPVEEVTQLSEAISKYGIATISVAILFIITMLVILYLFMNNQKQLQILLERDSNRYNTLEEINKEYRELIRSQNDQLNNQLDSVMNKISEEVLEDHIPNEEIGDKLLVISYLKDLCRDTATSTGASRVSLYLLHNGQSSFSGFPFIKSTCIVEWVVKGRGVSSQISSQSNVPVSLLSKMLSSLVNNGTYCIKNTELIVEDPVISNLLLSNNIKSVCYSAITDDSGNILGYSSAEFIECHEDSEKDILDNLHEKLSLLNTKVSPILITNKDILKVTSQ